MLSLPSPLSLLWPSYWKRLLHFKEDGSNPRQATSAVTVPCNSRTDMEVHKPRPRNKLAAVAAHKKRGGGATYTVCGVSVLPIIAPIPNPKRPAPTAETLPACAGSPGALATTQRSEEQARQAAALKRLLNDREYDDLKSRSRSCQGEMSFSGLPLFDRSFWCAAYRRAASACAGQPVIEAARAPTQASAHPSEAARIPFVLFRLFAAVEYLDKHPTTRVD